MDYDWHLLFLVLLPANKEESINCLMVSDV